MTRFLVRCAFAAATLAAWVALRERHDDLCEQLDTLGRWISDVGDTLDRIEAVLPDGATAEGEAAGRHPTNAGVDELERLYRDGGKW